MIFLQKWRLTINFLLLTFCAIGFTWFSYNLYHTHHYLINFPEDDFWGKYFSYWLPQGLGLTLALVLFFNLFLQRRLDLKELIVERAKKKYNQICVVVIGLFLVSGAIVETNVVAYLIGNMILAGLYFFILPTMKKRLLASA